MSRVAARCVELHSPLAGAEKRVHLALADRLNEKTDQLNPSGDRLAKDAECGSATVKRAKAKLRDHGLLEEITRGRNVGKHPTSSTWRLNLCPECSQGIIPTGSGDCPGIVDPGSLGIVEDAEPASEADDPLITCLGIDEAPQADSIESPREIKGSPDEPAAEPRTHARGAADGADPSTASIDDDNPWLGLDDGEHLVPPSGTADYDNPWLGLEDNPRLKTVAIIDNDGNPATASWDPTDPESVRRERARRFASTTEPILRPARRLTLAEKEALRAQWDADAPLREAQYAEWVREEAVYRKRMIPLTAA